MLQLYRCEIKEGTSSSRVIGKPHQLQLRNGAIEECGESHWSTLEGHALGTTRLHLSYLEASWDLWKHALQSLILPEIYKGDLLKRANFQIPLWWRPFQGILLPFRVQGLYNPWNCVKGQWLASAGPPETHPCINLERLPNLHGERSDLLGQYNAIVWSVPELPEYSDSKRILTNCSAERKLQARSERRSRQLHLPVETLHEEFPKCVPSVQQPNLIRCRCGDDWREWPWQHLGTWAANAQYYVPCGLWFRHWGWRVRRWYRRNNL